MTQRIMVNGYNVQEEYVATIFGAERTTSASRLEALDCSRTLTPVLHPTCRYITQNCDIERVTKTPNFTILLVLKVVKNVLELRDGAVC
jgi:hypothetical protein